MRASELMVAVCRSPSYACFGHYIWLALPRTVLLCRTLIRPTDVTLNVISCRHASWVCCCGTNYEIKSSISLSAAIHRDGKGWQLRVRTFPNSVHAAFQLPVSSRPCRPKFSYIRTVERLEGCGTAKTASTIPVTVTFTCTVTDS